jgi:hypothetical protein
MLSVACHESPQPQPAEPAPAVYSLRRLAVTFDSEDRRGRNTRRRQNVTTVTIPAYSRIVFRAGTAQVR